MIEPARCSVIDGATARIPRNTPTVLTSITRWKSSSEVSCSDAARKMPALLRRMSIRPWASRADAATACQSVSLVTSCAHDARPVAQLVRERSRARAVGVAEEQSGTLRGEPSSGRRADAACRAGDDGDLPLQPRC